MDFLYYFVTKSFDWEPKYHQNFFVDHNAFVYGLVWAIVLALVFAIAFYFCLCNNKESCSSAKLPVWLVFLALSGISSYLVADWGIIGKKNITDQTSVFYKYSFYNTNEAYYAEQARNNSNEQLLQELAKKKNEIRMDLNQGNDVRVPFDMTCAVYGLIFFYLFSVVLKGFTINGKTIPHMWPSK